MSYIDWEYYNSHFPKVEKQEFERLLPQAEMKVEVLTHLRCQGACGYKLDRVKAAVANLVNALYDQEQTGAGKGITSVSNSGYSESYANVTTKQAEASLRSVCFQWLSGTGMMGCL